MARKGTPIKPGYGSVLIVDDASPWLKWAAKEFPGYLRSALKSVGNWLREEVKKGMKAKAPGGRRWVKQRMNTKQRQSLEKVMGGPVKGRYPLMGRLASSVGYQYIESEEAVIVGPRSQSGYRLFALHETGFTRTVTPRMRAAYAKTLTPLKAETAQIHTRARPTWEPVFRRYSPEFAPRIEEKIWSYLNGNTLRSKAKSTRIYKVYRMW